MRKWLSCAILGLLPVITHAAGFAAADLVFSNVEPDGTDSDVDLTAAQFRFGSWLNSEGTLGFEFRAALGMDDDSLNGVDIEIDRYYGAYLRGQFPNSMQVRPYGILGLTRIETTESPGGSENYSDVSLGLGADMSLNRNMFVSLEYLRVIDRSGDEVSNLGLGIGGRF